MEPNEFISEVYRRGAALMPGGPVVINVETFVASADKQRIAIYKNILPSNLRARIIDIGSGNGEFLSACNALGYEDVTAADFRAVDKFKPVTEALPNIKTEDFSASISEHFSKKNVEYDVIHFAHIIEHVYKYDLIETMDALYSALKPGGMIIVRTPNMEGPAALSSYYVTLAHEYGFVASNLRQLLHICNFKDITFIDADRYGKLSGRLMRKPFKLWQRMKSRLFGVSVGNQFGSELVATAIRRE